MRLTAIWYVCVKQAAWWWTLHWQVKIVGVSDFPPLPFRLIVGISDKLKDSKGRSISTVFAEPITDAEREVMDETADTEKSEVLSLMREKPGLSLAVMAKELGWFYSDGNSEQDQGAPRTACLNGCQVGHLKNSMWELTKAGRDAARPRQPPQGDIPY